MRTNSELRAFAFRTARRSLMLMLGFIGLVSLWAPLTQPAIAEWWFTLPNFVYLAPVPLVTLIIGVGAWWALAPRAEVAPFLLSIGLFALSHLGLVISLWPYIVPRALTLWESASPPESQQLVLVGLLIFMPFVLAYTTPGYRVCRGKVREGEGYG